MPDEKKLIDPFKPQQPNVPGVLPEAAKPATSSAPQGWEPRRPPANPFLRWTIAGVIGLAVIAGGLTLHRGHSSAQAMDRKVSDAAALAAPATASTAKTKSTLPHGPGVIATTEELAKAWSAKRFLFPDSVTGEIQPAMVVRLPRGEFWGFSLREPFGTCELEYVSDLEKLRTDYAFAANHPMVVDPCQHTVYDLLRYGGSNDGLVRGDIVQGAGIRPPMAIEIKTRGSEVVAVRME
jgi:hypothetical protein